MRMSSSGGGKSTPRINDFSQIHIHPLDDSRDDKGHYSHQHFLHTTYAWPNSGMSETILLDEQDRSIIPRGVGNVT